jgi:hypothetical protein
VLTKEVVWAELSQPHTPRLLPDGTKCVCDSYAEKLLVNRGGEISSVSFPNKYPRGIAFNEKQLYVGLSNSRNMDENTFDAGPPGVAVVDRKTLAVEQVVPLPVIEVYDILVVS